MRLEWIDSIMDAESYHDHCEDDHNNDREKGYHCDGVGWSLGGSFTIIGR